MRRIVRLYMLRVCSSLCVHLNMIQVRGACSSAGCHDVILPPLHCFHASLSHTTVGRLKPVCVCVSGAKGEGLGSASRPLFPVSPDRVSVGNTNKGDGDRQHRRLTPEEPPHNTTQKCRTVCAALKQSSKQMCMDGACMETID